MRSSVVGSSPIARFPEELRLPFGRRTLGSMKILRGLSIFGPRDDEDGADEAFGPGGPAGDPDRDPPDDWGEDDQDDDKS